MVLAVANLAKEQEEFIRETLNSIEIELHPSVTEDEEMVRRALFAVRNQSVQFLRYISVFSILTTSVQDVRPTEVTIDFRSHSITCTCPQKGWCRHKLSVILSLYQYIDSVQEWVASWRGKKSVDLQALANVRTPENWLRMVDEVLGHYLDVNNEIPSFLYLNIAENALEKLNKQMPFEREWQPIYRLFMELAVLNKFWIHLMKCDSSVDTDFFQHFFDKRFQSIQNIIHEVAGKSRLFATDPFFDAMQQMIRELLLKRNGHLGRRMNLYLLFWDEVFVEKRRAMEELQLLQDLELATIPEVFNVFYIILKNYDALEENMENVNYEHLDMYLGLAKFSYSKHDDRAGTIILRAILPHLHQFLSSIQPAFRSYIVKSIYSLYENMNLSEEEELILYSSFGKDGVQPYSSYLLKKRRYDEWVALHQMYPSSIAHLENYGLKEVLEEAPEVTLPLFHYYAMEEVSQKSRLNYKQAVRIWKKMKIAAKKAGKMNYWSDYIHSIRDQYKRLRALQEELEKGNLFI